MRNFHALPEAGLNGIVVADGEYDRPYTLMTLHPQAASITPLSPVYDHEKDGYKLIKPATAPYKLHGAGG